MGTVTSRGFQIATIVVLFAFWQISHGNPAEAQSAVSANSRSWLDKAVREKHCPSSPVNVPAAILQTTSGDVLQQGISISDDTLYINGTPNPNHIVIKPGKAPGVVEVTFDGKPLGSFGPAAQIVVQGGSGSDVMIVEPDVTLPVVLHGGAGDSCLQAGSGADQLFGGPGNDVLISGTGRPALDAGGGSNRVVVPQSMGVLWVAPAANGELLREIGTLYTLQPLPQGMGEPSQGAPSPIILGPADLADANVVSMLKATYAAGQAVVITNATTDDAARLRSLLGHPNAAEAPSPDEKADLIFFRKAPRPGTSAYDYRAGIFGHPWNTETQSPARNPSEHTIELLSRVFSATAIVPQAPSDGPSNDLTNLADSYTSSKINQDANGSQVQVVNMVWDVRSFQNKADYYYVQQEADFCFSVNESAQTWRNSAGADPNLYNQLSSIPTLIDPSPGSTVCTNTKSSSFTWNVGGSVGWNQTQGVNASVCGGVSVTKTKALACPQTIITNQSNLALAQPGWLYSSPVPSKVDTNIFYNQWVWEVPFSSYPSGTQIFQIASGADSRFSDNCPDNGCLATSLISAVPLPFGDTFALQTPTVLSVNPTCANAGSTFAISGTGMYPSLVTSVLIGGIPLSPNQYTTTSDTSISVIAPEQSGEFLPVVVQTAEGLSNSNVTIEISVIDLCGS